MLNLNLVEKIPTSLIMTIDPRCGRWLIVALKLADDSNIA